MRVFKKNNPFLTILYALRLHYYPSDGKNAQKVERMYRNMLSKDKGKDAVISHTNGQRLICNFAHQLPFYQRHFPLYDRQLAKLCLFIQKHLRQTVNIIDVGANVGDTVLNIGMKDAYYLCIEGNPQYSKYIKYNLKGYQYALEKVYLCDNNDTANYVIQSSNGTGHLIQNEGHGDSVNIVTLDHLLNSKYGNKQFDLLKIDTDGFDFKVIRGARHYLQRYHPLIFFEWDKAFCKEQGEDPLSIFPVLDELGYKECILFDNFGNVFDNVDTKNTALLKSYIENTIGEGLPYYYDVLAIPNNGNYTTKEILSIF